MEKIRIIDFSKAANQSLENNCQENLKKVGDEIVESFENIGFAYITNHGIPQEIIDNIFKILEAFSSLPPEVKKNYAKKDLFESGYVEPSREIFNKSEHVRELRESFDVIQDSRECFPSDIEGFERNILKIIEIISEFLEKILRCLEVGLDLPFGSIINMHTNLGSRTNISVLRLLHYPPILFDVPENCIRCGTHTDYGTITILFQDSMGGLEVKNRNNEWVKANPIPGTILVNVGDMLQKLTSERLIATPHRVLIPKEEKRRKCSRKSFVFFLNPNLDSVLKPFEAPNEDGKSYPTCQEYYYSRLNSTFTY